MLTMRRNAILAVVALAALSAAPVMATPPLPGAVFTTDSTCTGVNLNIYGDKGDVYLDGGPAHTGAAGLADGEYYVQVTEPDGSVLGTSIGSADETPVSVSGGEFSGCLRLWDILVRTSDATIGYDDTTNPGGEYKVWVSNDPLFANNSTKTDNFKVKVDDPPPPDPAHLTILKFYDRNANGVNDGEALLGGWLFEIDDANHTSYHSVRCTPVDIVLGAGDYAVAEGSPVESNWFHTTAAIVPVQMGDDDVNLQFGNVCVGAGGGLTLGFWSNKNGQSTMAQGGMSIELAFLSSLNLKDGKGLDFNPTTYLQFRNWLLSGTATNMAYMLSVQLSAMEMNVYNGKVDGGALIYAPGTNSANGLGFAAVGAVMAEANTELGLHPLAGDGTAWRSYQEALKNALDNANNNRNFVQASACAYSFANGCN